MANVTYRARPVAYSNRTLFFFGALVESFGSWNDARRTRAELSRLTTQELADIGIERCDIERIAERRY